MIDLLIHCEWAMLGNCCEDNETLELREGATLTPDGTLTVETTIELPEGWTTVDERGAPRLRCPKHRED